MNKNPYLSSSNSSSAGGSGSNKASLLFSIGNKVGGLAEVLDLIRVVSSIIFIIEWNECRVALFAIIASSYLIPVYSIRSTLHYTSQIPPLPSLGMKR